MLIREVMESRLDVVSPDQTLVEAAKKMREDDIGALPVIDDDRRLVGIVALADIARDGSRSDAAVALHDISEPTPRSSRTI